MKRLLLVTTFTFCFGSGCSGDEPTAIPAESVLAQQGPTLTTVVDTTLGLPPETTPPETTPPTTSVPEPPPSSTTDPAKAYEWSKILNNLLLLRDTALENPSVEAIYDYCLEESPCALEDLQIINYLLERNQTIESTANISVSNIRFVETLDNVPLETAHSVFFTARIKPTDVTLDIIRNPDDSVDQTISQNSTPEAGLLLHIELQRLELDDEWRIYEIRS